MEPRLPFAHVYAFYHGVCEELQNLVEDQNLLNYRYNEEKIKKIMYIDKESYEKDREFFYDADKVSYYKGKLKLYLCINKINPLYSIIHLYNKQSSKKKNC